MPTIDTPVTRSPLKPTILLAVQFAVGAASLGLLAFAPPARGEMLLMPLVDGAPVVRLVRRSDALLLARGPGEALIVRGDRSALFWPLLRAGVLTIASPKSLCGGQR